MLQPCMRKVRQGARGRRITRFLALGFIAMSLHHDLRSMMFGALALALAGAPAFAADALFPLNSHVGLAPPAGFVASQRFGGFENPQANAVILLSAMPAGAYPELEKSLSDEALKQ